MRQESLDNTYSRYIFLLGGLKNPNSITKKQVSYLSGQRKFASLCVKEKFSAISLNTLKEAANIVLEKEAVNKSGFEYLDELRSQLYGKVKRKKPSRSTAKAKERRNAELNHIKSMLREAEVCSLVRIKAYTELIEKLKALLLKDDLEDKTRIRLRNILNHHEQLYSDLLKPSSDLKNTSLLKLIHGGIE